MTIILSGADFGGMEINVPNGTELLNVQGRIYRVNGDNVAVYEGLIDNVENGQDDFVVEI